MTKPGDGPVHLALGRPLDTKEDWFVVREEPTESRTFEAYGRRCDLEEHCLDAQAPGFQLEASLLRSAQARDRLWCLLAFPTLSLVAQGPAVVTPGKRRWVDAPWLRGQRSLKIGWNAGATCRESGVGISSPDGMSPLKPILYPPWPQTFSPRNTLSCASLWSSKMPSHDRPEFCQSIRTKCRNPQIGAHCLVPADRHAPAAIQPTMRALHDPPPRKDS